MTSVYENKFDVIFRKLQDEKAQLKKDFDSAYSKDDFRTSMGIMEEIQEVMNKLSALESVEKPFKEIAQISSRVEDLKLEIEIHLEELGKQIKSMDELQGLIDGELETPMKTLKELFSREAERNFTFNFNKFSDDELMTLIHYRKSNFPSRLGEYENYWDQTINSRVAANAVISPDYSGNNATRNLDLDAPLNTESGGSLNSNCYLDSDEDLGANDNPLMNREESASAFDHGVQNLSDFERRNHIPVLTDEETSRILADSESEPVDIEFAVSSDTDSSEEITPLSNDNQESSVTSEEVENYESEVTELFDVGAKDPEGDAEPIAADNDLTISVEDIEQDLISESIEKVEEVAELSTDEDFAVSVTELENEFVAYNEDSEVIPDNHFNTTDDENLNFSNADSQYDSSASDELYVDDNYTEEDLGTSDYSDADYAEEDYSEESYSESEFTEADQASLEYEASEYAEDEYSTPEYSSEEYTESEYSETEYAEGEYTEEDYAEGEYTEEDYAEGEYTEEGYAEGEYTEDDYAEGEYAEGEYVENDYSEDGHSDESYSENEYSDESLDTDESLTVSHEVEDQLPLDELSIDLDQELVSEISDSSQDIDQLELDEPEDIQINETVTNEDGALDIDDIEIDLDESSDIQIEVDDTVLDLDESESSDDLSEELNLDDIQIDLDEE